MFKFFLSIFMLFLMPLRFLFILSILLNIALVIILHNFIVNENYFKASEISKRIENLGINALENSCNYSTKCSLKIYAKFGSDLKQTFEKTINEEKIRKRSLLESIKAPIKKLILESEIKSSIEKNDYKDLCFKSEKNIIICSSDEVVAVFKAEECPSCLDNFESEFKSLAKKQHKNFIIKVTYNIHKMIANFFGLNNPESQNSFTKKIKSKLHDLML